MHLTSKPFVSAIHKIVNIFVTLTYPVQILCGRII